MDTVVLWYFIAILIAIPVIFVLNFVYGVWRDTRPDRMRAVFVNQNRQMLTQRVTVESNGKAFRIKVGNKAQKYSIVDEAVVRTGMFRIPTSYYILGQKEPLDLLTMKAVTEKSAEDFEEATETHVAQDIIEAFSNPFVTPTTTMIIVVLVVVVAVGLSWYSLSGDIETIIIGLGLEETAPVTK